jgi:ABC-type dipeptide/oligopeptide/nickel transport system permease component
VAGEDAVSAAAGLLRIAATAALSFLLAWMLADCAPGGAAERAARAAGTMPPDDAPAAARAAAIARAAEVHDLAGPWPRLAALDPGRSWRDHRPVTEVLGDALPATARIAGLALVLALAGGAAAGAAMARTRRRVTAAAAGVAVAIAAAVPPAWLALLVFDAAPGAGELAAAAALALAPAAAVAVQVRAQLAGFLAGPLAAAVRARGASERGVTRHGLAAAVPALAPLLTSVGAYALGASVVVERAFAIPGLGRVTLDAASRGDAPVLAAVAALAGAVVAALSVIADRLAARVDPRLEAS